MSAGARRPVWTAAGIWRRLTTAAVTLVALHSLGVAVALLAFTEPAVRLGGFPGADPPFFARQVGVFHLVVALVYLFEYARERSVVLLVTIKTVAVVFLAANLLLDELPWSVLLSALGDGAMALGVALLARRAAREETAR